MFLPRSVFVCLYFGFRRCLFVVPSVYSGYVALLRGFCASRPVFRCSAGALPSAFVGFCRISVRLSSVFVIRLGISVFINEVCSREDFIAGRLSVGFSPRRCGAVGVPSAFR